MKRITHPTFFNQALVILICAIFLCACSSDGEPEVDPIVGTWVGISTQEDLGNIELEITFTETAGIVVGNLTSELNDLSMCDPNIFICEPGSCTTRWAFVSKTGSTYQFKETRIAGDCGDESDISIDLIGNDRLEGIVSFDIDPGDVVIIEMNEIVLTRK